MNLTSKLEEIVSEVATLHKTDPEIVREILISTIKDVKNELNNPKYDSVEWLNFGSFTINRVGFHVTLANMIYTMRRLKKRKYPPMPLLNGLRNSFREIWYFKQELINERINKRLRSYGKKRCV